MYNIIVVENEQIFLCGSTLKEIRDLMVARELINSGRNPEEAYKTLMVYVDKKNPEAEYLFSMTSLPNQSYEEVEKKHLHYLQKSANKSYPPALYRLGAYYDTGDRLTVDKEKAANLFKKAAMNGHSHSKWIHGEDLLHGRNGVSKNEALGVRFINSAAEDKFVAALETIAQYHEKGLFGLEKNNQMAEEWRSMKHHTDTIDLS